MYVCFFISIKNYNSNFEGYSLKTRISSLNCQLGFFHANHAMQQKSYYSKAYAMKYTAFPL